MTARIIRRPCNDKQFTPGPWWWGGGEGVGRGSEDHRSDRIKGVKSAKGFKSFLSAAASRTSQDNASRSDFPVHRLPHTMQRKQCPMSAKSAEQIYPSPSKTNRQNRPKNKWPAILWKRFLGLELFPLLHVSFRRYQFNILCNIINTRKGCSIRGMVGTSIFAAGVNDNAFFFNSRCMCIMEL